HAAHAAPIDEQHVGVAIHVSIEIEDVKSGVANLADRLSHDRPRCDPAKIVELGRYLVEAAQQVGAGAAQDVDFRAFDVELQKSYTIRTRELQGIRECHGLYPDRIV